MNTNGYFNQIIDRLETQRSRRVRHPANWAGTRPLWLGSPSEKKRRNGRNMDQASVLYGQTPSTSETPPSKKSKKSHEYGRMLYAAAALALVVGGYGGYRTVHAAPKTAVTSIITYDMTGVW